MPFLPDVIFPYYLFLCLFTDGFLFDVGLFCLRGWKIFAYSKVEHNSGATNTQSASFVQTDFSLEVRGISCLVEATLGRCVNMGSTHDDFNSARFDNDHHYCDDSRLHWEDFLAHRSVVCTIKSVRITFPFSVSQTVNAVINQVI
jgi:hypothetical protein